MRDNWEIGNIGEACEILDNRRKPITKKDRVEGDYPYYGATGILSYVEGYIFDEKLVLLGEDGAKWESGDNSAFIINGKTWVNNHAHVLRPNRKVLLDEWLVYNLNFQNLMTYVSGMTVPKLNQGNMKKIQIPIPPIKEQKEIIEILDQTFESIEKAKANIEKNIENAKELFQSKANQIFSQAGEGWEETNIGEIGKVSMCKRILKHQTSQTGEIPFYKIGTFGKEPNAYINAETFNLFKEKYSYPKIGDILLSASGTIGRRVIFDGKPAYFQDSNIVWIDNNEEIILNKYLYHFYEFCDWNPSKGATIKRLYNDDLRRIKISYPTCLERQKEIIEVIEILDNHTQSLLTSYEEELKNLEELKKSILQKAFNGELTNKSVAA